MRVSRRVLMLGLPPAVVSIAAGVRRLEAGEGIPELSRQGVLVEIRNPTGVPYLPSVASAGFSQRVLSRTATSVRLSIRLANPLELRPEGIIGIVTGETQKREWLPDREPLPPQDGLLKFREYLRPTPNIQADHPELVRLTRQLKDGMKAKTLGGLIEAVRSWLREYVQRGPDEAIPSALQTLRQGCANCVGYAHLAAAVLRCEGYPTRTVRVFTLPGRSTNTHLVRHHVVEVYLSNANQWILYDPETGVCPLQLPYVYLYADADWSKTGQARTRPLSDDPRTRVTLSQFVATDDGNAER